MIANPERSILLSSLGWVDSDELWLFDVGRRATEAIPLSTGARYASLHHSGTSRFAVAHHFDGERLEVSVRSFSAPSEILARAVVEKGRQTLTGDSSVWMDVPRLYVEHLGFAPWNESVLIRILPSL